MEWNLDQGRHSVSSLHGSGWGDADPFRIASLAGADECVRPYTIESIILGLTLETVRENRS